MIQLTDQQYETIQKALLEIPAKYANPILNYLEQIKNNQTLIKEDVPKQEKAAY